MKTRKQHTHPPPVQRKPLPRGFAVMAPRRVQAIASLGGQAVSANRRHMARIGAVGGRVSQAVRRIHQREGELAGIGKGGRI